MQELVHPADFIVKLYSKFGQVYVNYSNTLDADKCGPFEALDVKKHLKAALDVEDSQVADLMPLLRFLASRLRARGLDNFGLDLVYTKGSPELYVIDVNEDNFGWAKLNTGTGKAEFYRQNLVELSKREAS